MSKPLLGFAFLVSLLFAMPAGAQVSYTDRAAAAGVADLSYGRAAAMSDLDGDGLLDLVAFNTGMPNQFYRQTTLGSFVDTTAAWGLVPDTLQHWAAVVADLDNDGDDDIYVATGGFLQPEPNQLLRNNLNTTGQITDMSAVGLDAGMTSQNFGATTQDFDNDGDLDIFLTTMDETSRCILLSNQQNGQFLDISLSAGLFQAGHYMHCGSGDFDNDGWADVGAGDLVGGNVLYWNKGNGTFKDIAGQLGVQSQGSNFGFVLEDFNNDGRLDLFLPKYNNLQPATTVTELYLNNAAGAFVNISAGLGLTAQTDMGHNTGDLDGDGYPDIYIGTGNPSFKGLDIMYLVTPNGASLNLNNVSATSGIWVGGPSRCHGMAFGDYDQDGVVDIFVNNGGPSTSPSLLEAHDLLQGLDNGNRWASFELEGVRSNRSAIGAHLTATTDTGRQVHRWRRSGHGFGNTNSPIQRVGIGTDANIQNVLIRWPSGILQTLVAPAMSQIHQVVETGMILTGKTLVGGKVNLALVGPAGQSVDLYMSAGSLQLPLPGIGQLGLLPPFIYLSTKPLDGSGQGSAALPIPANPALVGLTVFVQGLFHDTGSVTNSFLSNTIPVTIK